MTSRLHINRAIALFSRFASLRRGAGFAAALLVWTFSSKGLADALIIIAFLLALFKASRGVQAWRQPAGIAFIVVFCFTLLTIPFSTSPCLSAREFIKFLPIAAGAFAISVFFNSARKIESALLYSATAIAATLAYDLVRLYVRLGPDILEKAHSFKPFILNHSNVASVMAGAAAFVFFCFFWKRRDRLPAACFYLLGLLICLAYLVILKSRGPQIAFLAASLSIGFFIPSRRGKLLWLVCSLLVCALLVSQASFVNPRFSQNTPIENLSDRDKVWSHTWKLALEHPIKGHGYGKKNFVEIYYASNPPEARFHFPHPHQLWLKILFESGWLGLLLQLAAWFILARGLALRIAAEDSFGDRLLPVTVMLILLLIHAYGMGDYPDNIVRLALCWLIPAALVLMEDKTEDRTKQ